MGGAVSAGQDNDELVDNLCYDDYITTPDVESAFRIVDRADYMQFGDKEDHSEAYEDHAWRRGTLHLSAPCIYSRALEALELKPGLSFLNVGSGTGYFSTMVGLLIGPYGVNHGVEVYEENVEFANERVAQFESCSSWYDPAKFCEPLFVVGNGLQLSAGNMHYDRIYCGAGCSAEHAHLFKSLLKVGGILVMPRENQLEVIRCASPQEWTVSVALPSVSFAPLILPTEIGTQNVIELTAQPLSLKELCRIIILVCLTRKSYDKIGMLPLPPSLLEYVSNSRNWDPEPPLKILCPVDHTKQRPRKKQRGDNGGQSSVIHSRSANEMQVLFCSFNGNLFQVPIDRHAIEDESREEDGRRGGDGMGDEDGRREEESAHGSSDNGEAGNEDGYDSEQNGDPKLEEHMENEDGTAT
eukprot:Em0023g338a